MSKLKKLVKATQNIISEPSLLNLVLDENSVREQEHFQKYPNLKTLPQLSFDELLGAPLDADVDLFVLDGGSLPTDIALLKSLSQNKKNYFEIGTWRGESVWNVAKNIHNCYTLNLSKKEMMDLGWNPKYAELHGILSKKNPNIKHLESNTKTFDFKSLDQKFDLIFIDGDHSYDMVKHDTEKVFENLMHENTVVVWHDYAYNPEKVRYEVFKAILDALPAECHQHLYHVENTMCAVFVKGNFKTKTFESPKTPESLFKISVKQNSF
ncbi:class I SAM-dependent methyltransferase [Soonwooa sp.]|uniref:class I SAM-dependent methyltransferase n=1 Tax=Soonwooa sp. TaxID=1938592 RepID=UPI0028A9C0A7|nr:class I SAM-dependent methyltransferase [Soonwooa sp.]